MKTVKLLVVSTLISLIASSCVVPRIEYGPVGAPPIPYNLNPNGFNQGLQRYQGYNPYRGYNPYGVGEPQITGYTRHQTGVKKTEVAYFEARLWNSEDPVMKKQATDWAARYFERNHRVPSDEEVSSAVGFRCQIRRVR